MKHKNPRILFLYFSLCLLLVVSTLVTCIFVAKLYYVVFLDSPFRYDADYYWCEDSIYLFISERKKMPINWTELKENAKQHSLYSPIQGIEERVEINFTFFAKLNERQNEELNVNKEVIWLFRFNGKPDTIDQQKLLKRYISLLHDSK